MKPRMYRPETVLLAVKAFNMFFKRVTIADVKKLVQEARKYGIQEPEKMKIKQLQEEVAKRKAAENASDSNNKT